MKTDNSLVALMIIAFIFLGSQLIAKSKYAGMVSRVSKSNKEIIVRSPNAFKKFYMGKKVYLKINGKTVSMLVTFPMATVAKCKLIGRDKRYLSRIKKNMKVYLTKKSASLNEIKSIFDRIDEIVLYTGRTIKGAIIKRGRIYTVLTINGKVKIHQDKIQTVRVIK